MGVIYQLRSEGNGRETSIGFSVDSEKAWQRNRYTRAGNFVLCFDYLTANQSIESEGFLFLEEELKLDSMRKLYDDVLVIDLDRSSSCVTRCQTCVSHTAFLRP